VYTILLKISEELACKVITRVALEIGNGLHIKAGHWSWITS
jgi:hypothetical protein